MAGWKRVKQCQLCGGSRCVESTVNHRMAYCYRYGKTFFLSNDRRHNLGIKDKEEKACENQQDTFDFGQKHFDV